MTRCLALPEPVYQALERAAAAAGCSVADWIAARLAEAETPPATHTPDQPQQEKAAPLPAEVEQLRAELRDSFKNRALFYWYIYDELRKVFGPEQAEAVMGRAIYRRGVEKGRELYARFAPGDLAGLREAFIRRSADQGRLFQPEVQRADQEALDIQFHACPLREAWQEAGLPDAEVAVLCRIAAQVDYGTFEGAGFRFWADTWQPGGEGCCFLHIRPGPLSPP